MTPAELAAARAFRLRQLDWFGPVSDRRPVDVRVSVFIRCYRHDCAKQGGKSVFLELREHYARSPEMVVFFDERRPLSIAFVDDGAGPEFAEQIRTEGIFNEVIPAGRFGFIWTEGKCSVCGLTARSSAGRLVDPAIRPPAEHAIVC